MYKKIGVDGFKLKLLAMVLMLLDHIYYIFEFTGKVPVFFSWLGRLSGGLFLFTMVEGYRHTSNKKKYFTRIYLMGVLMSLVRYLLQFLPALQRGDGFYPMNGIFQTFSILIIIFTGIDLVKEKKLRGWTLILLAIILPYTVLLAIQLSPIPMNFKNTLFVIFSSLLPMIFMVEGGIFILISGIILYVFRENRKRQALLFLLFHFAWMTIIPVVYIRPINLKLMFTDYYEWMGAFASLIMLSYNGKRGRPMKKLFYIFYPAHIYILYGLSILNAL